LAILVTLELGTIITIINIILPYQVLTYGVPHRIYFIKHVRLTETTQYKTNKFILARKAAHSLATLNF